MFLVDQLIDILKSEATLYDSILKVSRKKTGIIIDGKISELESITKLEQAIVMQVGKLEDARENLVEKLSAQLNLDSSRITISDISKLLQREQANRLNTCQFALEKVLEELKSANELNSKLIKNSLEYIDFSINLLANTSVAGNLYGNSGRANDSKMRNFFDMKL